MPHAQSERSQMRHGSLSLDRIEIAAPQELLDDAILRPTPLLRLWGDWAEACCPKRQPLIAMLAGITAFSAVMGRSYRGPTHAIAPLTTLVLAPPGAGKDHPQEMAKHFMKTIGMEGHLGASKWGSGQGLERELSTKGEMLAISDEFADVIESFCHPNCPSYKKDILSIVKQVYTGNDYAGTAIKDGDKTMIARKPRLAILASAQPVVFWRSVTPRVIADGFMSRMLVLAAAQFGRRDHSRKLGLVGETMPEGIKEYVEKAMLVRPAANSPGSVFNKDVMPKEIRIPYRDAAARQRAEQLIDYYDDRANAMSLRGLENEPALIARSFERMIKLAAVYAWTERTEDLSVSVEGIEWAHVIVQASDRCVLGALTETAGEDQNARRWATYKRLISGGGEQGLAACTLIARTRFGKNDHESLIKQMMASNVISVSHGKRGGAYYVWTGEHDEVEPASDREQIFPAKKE